MKLGAGNPRAMAVVWNQYYLIQNPLPLVITEQWSGVQQAFAVKGFDKNGNSMSAAQMEFQHHYQLGRCDCILSADTIKWVHNFEEMGSALKKKFPGSVQMAHTPENIEAIQQLFGRCIISPNCDIP